MKLHSITLKNYRLFPELHCDLHPSLTVFVANNGAGKTSILDAIRVLFDTYLAAFPSGKGRGIKLSDVRQVRSNDELALTQQAFPVEIRASGNWSADSPAASWSLALNTAKSKTTSRDAQEPARYAQQLQHTALVRPGFHENWPLLAYYGTGRLWLQKNLTAIKHAAIGYNSRAGAYADCMDPASGFKYFAEWYRYAYRAVMASQHRFMQQNSLASRADILAHQSAFSPLIAAVQQAVDAVLAPSGWRNLAYSVAGDEITAEHDEFGTLPVAQLSDGIRSVLALVADIAYRAVQLNPHLGKDAAMKTCGVVLIDEVDMHLHPSWQQIILSSLQTAFPSLQFIVTTHSPQVLTSIDASCIRQLQQGMRVHEMSVVRHVTQQTKGVASSDLLAEIMGVNPVPDIPEARMVADYHDLIQQNQYATPAGSELRQRLEHHFGAGHPILLECDRLIRLHQFKQKLPARSVAS